MAKFTVYYKYSSQWYDQGDDDYVPESHKGQFEVEAEDMKEAEEKAQAEIGRRNERGLRGAFGDDEETIAAHRQFKTHFIESIKNKGDLRSQL